MLSGVGREHGHVDSTPPTIDMFLRTKDQKNDQQSDQQSDRIRGALLGHVWLGHGRLRPSTRIQVTPIERARRDLSIGTTLTSVGTTVDECHPIEGQYISCFQSLVGGK